MKIRFAEKNDLESIVNIYNQAVSSGNATADLNKISIKDRLDWFAEHCINKYPVYIMELENKIIGWGSLSPYRKGREGLKATAEISYYIDYVHHGSGYGKQLIGFILQDCERVGINNLFAILLEINDASKKVLEHFGFSKWGFMPDVVNINGITCGHLIYGKNLD